MHLLSGDEKQLQTMTVKKTHSEQLMFLNSKDGEHEIRSHVATAIVDICGEW